GGSATYFSIAASYFTKVNLVAIVGGDFPEDYLNLLKERSIDLRGLETREGKTFRWEGRYGVDPNERETLSLCLNVFEDFHPRLIQDYRSSDYVFLANIDPSLHLEILKQLTNSQLIAGDTMNIWIEKKRNDLLQMLTGVDAFILNDSEARMLTEEENLVRAGRAILSYGPKIAIIKKGEHGVLLFSESDYFAAPAYPVESLCDPTGAGDSFAGGFLGYLAESGRRDEESLRKAVIYGSIMASFTVEGFSLDCLKTVTRKDVEKRYREFEDLVRF
ncbi:MAG: sugar kinase, partial [Nitrospirae bacterium]|nr:sugar kinase [Nitrospirota bacterium]